MGHKEIKVDVKAGCIRQEEKILSLLGATLAVNNYKTTSNVSVRVGVSM